MTVGAVAESPYFRDEIDRLTWLRRLTVVLERWRWVCLSFCQLTTHVHLVVETTDESLPSGMHELNSRFAQEVNERHDRRGVLQRARYWSARKDTPETLLEAYRYVALNPVEAGLVPHPVEWMWSSFATSCGINDAFPFVDAGRVIGELGGDPRSLLELVAKRSE